MSNNLDPTSNPLNIQTIQEIDNLDLTIMQKHHIRILAHCLQILKIINKGNSFEDKNFSDLFYKQIDSTAKKLYIFSKRIGKKIVDLEIDDLVLLVEQS